jgi:hypothetical protein
MSQIPGQIAAPAHPISNDRAFPHTANLTATDASYASAPLCGEPCACGCIARARLISHGISIAQPSTLPIELRSPKRVLCPGSSFSIRHDISRLGCLSGRSAIGTLRVWRFSGEKVGFSFSYCRCGRISGRNTANIKSAMRMRRQVESTVTRQRTRICYWQAWLY